MTLALSFDCAVSGLGVAVVRDDTALAVHREAGREQAARLLPAIAETLIEAGVERRDLSMIVVTVGPGSFTGVRVGLAAARGLAVALDLPLAGFTTTAVLLAQASRRDREASTYGTDDRRAADRYTVAVLDSHLGDWFCAVGEGETAPFLATTSGLAQRLGGRPSRLIGPQATALAADLAAAGLDVDALPALPDPVVLATLATAQGLEAWRVRNRTEGLPRPFYLRGVNITLPDGQRRTVD
jgi:tRNA threonylcarbamoyladenosine biosynthesis protein TsaB